MPKIINFEVGKEYPGYYENSKKRCTIKIIKLKAQETEIEVSTMPNRHAILPTSKIFTIGDDGIEILRFYNVYKQTDFKRDYIVAYADRRIEKNELEDVAKKFIVGNVYHGRIVMKFEDISKEVRCIRRTKRYAEFEWDAKSNGVVKTVVGKLYIQTYGDAEYGVIKTRGYKDVLVDLL